jgi:hypothetical protein
MANVEAIAPFHWTNGRIGVPLPPESITRKDDPRAMVRVRRTGANVSEAFWAKLAGLYMRSQRVSKSTLG